MPQVRPVANLIRLAMQRLHAGVPPMSDCMADKESAPLPSRGGFPGDKTVRQGRLYGW